MAKRPPQPRTAKGQFGPTLATPALRRAVFAALCAHLRGGHGVGSFPDLAESTVYHLLQEKKCPEFDQAEFAKAQRESVMLLEKLALNAAATGQGSPQVALALLRNKAAFCGSREWRADDDAHLARKAHHDGELARQRVTATLTPDGPAEVAAGAVEVRLTVVPAGGADPAP